MLFTLDYEILEITSERNITRLEFDDYPYDTKIEMIAHWELKQEIAEYYNQKAERDVNKWQPKN